MTTTINASTSSGLVQTADTSGIIKLQSNGVTTNALAWGSYKYVAAGSTPTLRSSYNISSITRSSTGVYVFAFTNALSDSNYAVVTNPNADGVLNSYISAPTTRTTSNLTITCTYVSAITSAVTVFDYGVDFAVFGN